MRTPKSLLVASSSNCNTGNTIPVTVRLLSVLTTRTAPPKSPLTVLKPIVYLVDVSNTLSKSNTIVKVLLPFVDTVVSVFTIVPSFFLIS